LPLDEINNDWQVQSINIAGAAGVQLAMRPIAGPGLNGSGAFDAATLQEGENIVSKKTVSGSRITVEMD
jgi:hypothetical protein